MSEKSIITIIDDVFKDDENYVDFTKTDEVSKWIDSGNYALNFIMSGSFFKGYPVGRITSLEGLTGTGKSMFLASSLKDKNIETSLIFESEGGGFSKEILNFIKVDTKKIRQKKIRSFDSFKVTKSGDIIEIKDGEYNPKNSDMESGLIWNTRKILDIVSNNKTDKFFLLAIDSIANITSSKEISGSLDMGKRNQLANKFFRLFDGEFEKTNTCCIITNKLYTDLTAGQYGEKYVSSGGVAVQYNPSLIVRLEKVAESNILNSKEYSDEKENRRTSRGASLVALRCKITKSRFGTYGRRVVVTLDFNNGLIRKSGVFDILNDYGFLERSGSYYKFRDNKIYNKNFYRKNFESILTEDMLIKIEEIMTKNKNVYSKKVSDVSDVSDSEEDLDTMLKKIDDLNEAEEENKKESEKQLNDILEKIK